MPRRVINGSFHQGQLTSTVAGFQCTAIALFALLVARNNVGQLEWNQHVVDNVVVEGTHLYTQIILNDNVNATPHYLGHWEIPNRLNMHDRSFAVHRYDDIFYGVVSRVNTVQQAAGSVDIATALTMSSEISDFIMGTFGQATIAISRSIGSGHWFVFDSHSRDCNAEVSFDGSASYITFDTLQDLLHFIVHNYNTLPFNLTPVIFEDIEGNENERNMEYVNDLCKRTNTNSRHVANNENSVNGTTSQSEKLTSCTAYSMEESCSNNIPSHTEEIDHDDECFIRLEDQCDEDKKYENAIRETIVSNCESCERFLFGSQKMFLPGDRMLSLNGSSISIKADKTLCSKCLHQIIKGNVPPRCILNGLQAGEVPNCIKYLTLPERRLISQIQTYMTIVILPGGQYAEKGLCIHFPTDIGEYLSSLKKLKNEQYVIVQSPNHGSQTLNVKSLANMERVRIALLWLQEHNSLYSSFMVDDLADVTMENEPAIVSDVLLNGPEAIVVQTEYSPPDVDISHVISGQTLSIPTDFDHPVWIQQVLHGEELAFPWLFPYGYGGITEARKLKLTTLDYFQQRLYNKDPRWRKDITYLMHAVNHLEQTRLSDAISVHMRLSKNQNRRLPGQNITVTVGELSTADKISSSVKRNSFMFMKKIRGTVAYWADVLSNLLATVKCLGPPTLFLTLSADDCHWPELKMVLEDKSYSEAFHSSKCNDIRNDPLLTSIYFEKRWKALLKFILNGKHKPLGQIDDYFVRVEYQNRGSPHLHIFLWIHNAPSLGKSSSNEIISFIEKTVSTEIPSAEKHPLLHKLVKTLQLHKHTSSCKKINTDCRFNFPRKVTLKTKIINNDFTSDYYKGRFYETVRSQRDIYVNAYNPAILIRWRANMDIQMVSGVHGLAYYVCSYIAKAEPDDLKYKLSGVLHTLQQLPQPVSIRKELSLLGNCILKSRRLSAQEAAARIGHLQFVWSSRLVIFLNTRPSHERYRMLRPKCERDILPENSTDIFSTNLIDYYIDRPHNLDGLSLFKFASNYKLSSSSSLNVSERCLPRYKLLTINKIIQQRRRPVVIKTPKFDKYSDTYFFSLLMLHLPFRNESTLMHPFDTAEKAFLQKHSSFDIENLQFESYLVDIERIISMMQATRSDVEPIVAPNTAEPLPIEDHISSDHSLLSTEGISSDRINTSFANSLCNDSTDIQFHRLAVSTMSEDQFHVNMNTLTAQQMDIFNLMRKHFESHCTNPLRIFISGEGGTGKSYLLSTIVEWMRLYTSPCTAIDPVLVCGPTGMSALNINGKTLHNALKLPVQHGYQPSYQRLSNKVLSALRSFYQQVHTIVIDEISMVSSSMLTFIHRRLCEIKASEDYFGGLNIFLIGDFLQLRPVRGQFAFTNTLLWDLFDNYILNTNMRQMSHNRYAYLLNRARVGVLLPEDVDLLHSRLISNTHEDFQGVLRVYPTLQEVRQYNKLQQEKLSDCNGTTHVISAEHVFSTDDLGTDSNISEYIPKDDRESGGLPSSLTLSVGTRVMLIRNIATDCGLINGAMGFVTSIQFTDGNNVEAIYVSFDNKKIGSLLYNEQENAIEIRKISQEYFYHGRSIIRTQFPLIPAWACTIHKVQGITCDRIVVSLGKTVFAKGQAYVALSRVRSLDGLGLISFDISKVTADEKVVEFYRTLSLIIKHNH